MCNEGVDRGKAENKNGGIYIYEYMWCATKRRAGNERETERDRQTRRARASRTKEGKRGRVWIAER